MLNKLRPVFAPILNTIITPIEWIHPNVLSFGSFIVALLGFYFYVQGDSLLGSLFILGAAFDAVDGAVARKTNKLSKFGGVLDATLDRIFEGLLFLSIGIGGLVDWEILMLLLTASVSVSYIKSKAETLLKTESVGTNQLSIGFAQRGERLLIIFGASILNGLLTKGSNNILMYALILLLFLVSITLVMRGTVIYKLLKDTDK